MSEVVRFRVEKLIRDRLPRIMRDQGLSVFERRLDDVEFVDSLKAKLVEEAREAAGAASRAALVEELADLAEVILALTRVLDIGAEEVESVRAAKCAERGGFDDRVYNAAVSGPADLPAVAYYLERPGQYPRV
jgi:predicted house-cleaning noncanonical NTP pyrophosphatase (MazG superfamily)